MLFVSLMMLMMVAGTSSTDLTGERAIALQKEVDAAILVGKPVTIHIDGTYNFSSSSLCLTRCDAISLVGSGVASTTLLFDGVKKTKNGIAGVNFTDCSQSSLQSLSIDYDPKPVGLFCNARKTPACTPTGPGITIHMFNSSAIVVEDVTIFAAPYMAITSFNGRGGHTIRRVNFEMNAPGQIFVAERDGVHESDVRVGIRVEHCRIAHLNDDFFNVHNTLLVVAWCDPPTVSYNWSCIVINPHVESNFLDTTYGTNSLLGGATAGDALVIVPMITANESMPSKLKPLGGASLLSASRVSDEQTIALARAFANQTHADNSKKVMIFDRTIDVWQIGIQTEDIEIIPTSLISIESLSSSGAMFSSNVFNDTTCSARWKSTNSVFFNNTFMQAGANLEITYLQPWFEGGAFINNVTLSQNTFYYGDNVNPIHPNPMDTSNIHEENNRYLAPPTL
eukprot:m.42899 g.42899  ORF g.42899 m.42899 type:complete len:452 (-) comp19248_c0_seq1:217-1572(-)